MHEEIGKMVGLSQNRVSEIIGNAKFGEIDNLLSQGRNMDYIARHYHIDLPLAWAIRLEGKEKLAHQYSVYNRKMGRSYLEVMRTW